MKIFILKPSSLGDVIQALPVLRLIKRWRPEAEVYWWLEKDLSGLLEHDPHLKEVVPFDRHGWANPRNWNELWASIREIRGHRFDWVIDLQSLARSGTMAWLANGGLIAGLDDAREGARGYYDIIVPRASYHTHAVDWYLAVLTRLGVPIEQPFVWLPPRPAAREMLTHKWPIDSGQWIVLVPGARWDTKRWPAEYFSSVVKQLACEHRDLKFAILGANGDRALGEAIAQASPERCLNLAGKTSLPEMIEWIRLSRLVIANDTGPMHVAAALRKPLVALFGPTEPRRTGPYGQLESVLQTKLECVPCLKGHCAYAKPLECLRAIGPEAVVARANAVLSQPLETSESGEWRL